MQTIGRNITVLVVDDDDFFRASIESWFRADPRFRIAGSFPDGETALKELGCIKPDVALVDFGLPGVKGDEVIWTVKQQIPATKVIAVSGIPDDYVVYDALTAGADGFLDKPVAKTRLFEQIEELLAGGHPLSNRASRLVVDEYRKHLLRPSSITFYTLTDREREVAEMIAQSASRETIATKLGISIWTVHQHIAHIYDKLRIHSRTELLPKLYDSRPPPRSSIRESPKRSGYELAIPVFSVFR